MPKTFTFRNHTVAYRDEGVGPCLLMLHGWPTNAQLWRSQTEEFSAAYRVVAVDWLGFGASDKPEEHRYTFDSMVAVLDDLISVILPNGEPLTLIGHDIGGPPAILWAAANPERVDRLVLLNTVLYPLHTPLDRVSEFLFKVPLLRNLLASDFGLRRIIKANTKRREEDLSTTIGNLTAPFRNSTTDFIMRMISEPMQAGRNDQLRELATTLKDLGVRKHLIVAPEDPLCGEHMLRFCKEAPGVDAHFVERCGHYLPIDQPERINKILRSILEG